MALRSPIRTLADLRSLLANLEQNRHTYNRVSFAQLRRILQRRIAALTGQLRHQSEPPDKRRAA